MKQIDWSEEERAFLEEAGLQNMDWAKISQDLAYFEAEAQMKKMDIISNLDPAKTALFLGADVRSDCTAREKQEYCEHTDHVFRELLDMGITTIIVEDSTIYGFLAIGELIQLRQKYDFSLMIIHRKSYTYQWLHISDKEESRRRHLDSVYWFAICDKLLGAVSKAEWADICINHIGVAITEEPPYYCNPRVLTAEQYNRWGGLDENEARERKQWLLREDKRMALYAW